MSFIDAILLFLPAGLANGAPVIFAKMPGLRQLDTPLDFGKNWRHKRLFGENKTWRGLIGGALVGGISAIVIAALRPEAFANVSPFTAGLLLGFGALLGDALESLLKRQLSIKPGQTWFPFDQTDYVIGGLLLVSLIVDLTLANYLAILAVYFPLHLITVYIGFKLGIRQRAI